jgi:hypothetical protein
LGLGLPVSEASAQASASPGQTGGPAVAADARAVGGEGSAVAELQRLRISSQTWRRGGLGSRALVTFTLRNDSDHDVKDLEIACTFLRRDGNPLTERSRRMSDVVGMNSRKTFVRVSFGVVNVNADRAMCRLVTARRA